MCGIAGLISRAPLSPADIHKVQALNEHLRHRGPDGQGEYRGEHVMLAMRRLSIIDLASGWQPLYSQDRSLALVANGEIYNYVELRRKFEARGHRYATGSDCENILHAYEEYGDDFVDHLRGMYAFALWDGRRRRLILGRDRMGEKPLYLVRRGDSLYFSSELRALIQTGVIPFGLDPHALDQYFRYGYVPDPQCMVPGVRKLPAAHLLTVDLNDWTFKERCYWRMEDAPALTGDPKRLIREQLEEGAELITRADVPIGVALSGGLDASAVAALSKRARSKDVHAFTVGYAGTPWQDERNNAAAFARYLDIPFHTIELTEADVVEQFSMVNLHRDDPIADIAGIPIAAVARLARDNKVPVLLFGHGGDELFWGYSWVREALFITRRRQALARGEAGVWDYLRFEPPPFSFTLGLRWAETGGGLFRQLQQFREDRRADPNQLVFYDNEPFFRDATRQLRADFYSPPLAERLMDEPDPAHEFFAQRTDSPIEATLIRLICETYLMENGIAQGDRLTMAASVECRLPLVDYRLVETVVGLHKTYPLSRTSSPKQWLREALEGIVPEFVMRRRKVGFSPPWRQWGRAIARAFGDQLIDGYLVQRGVLEPRTAVRMRRELVPGLLGPRPIAGLSLALENWCRQLDASTVPSTFRFPVPSPPATEAVSPSQLTPGVAQIIAGQSSAYAMREVGQSPDPAAAPAWSSDAAVPSQAQAEEYTLGERALHGSAWLIGASGLAKAVGFVCQLILAGMLSRTDFGVYAIAISLSVILSILRDCGIPTVLEQKGRDFDRYAGPAFWMMLVINSVTGLMIAGSAPLAARWYHIPELADVMQLFAVSVPLCVLPGLLAIKLNLKLEFRTLGLIQLTSALIRNASLLLFAWAGFGARSFIWPLIITNLTDSLMLWAATRFSPWRLSPRFSQWPELFASGRWVVLGTFAIAFGNTGAYFLLGKLLPSDVLGIYFFAYQLVVQLGTLLADNVYQVLFAAFLRVGNDIARIRAAVPRALGIVTTIGATASLAVAAVFKPLESFLWHGKWAGAVHAVYVLALIWPAAAGVSVLRALQAAIGRFQQWGLVTFITALSQVSCTAIGAYIGGTATTAAVGFAIGNLVGATLNSQLAFALVSLHFRNFAHEVFKPWLVLAAVAWAAGFVGNLADRPVQSLLISASSFAILGYLGLAIFARGTLLSLVSSARRVLLRRRVKSPPFLGETV